MSKGSTRRPLSIPEKDFSDNWDSIFKRHVKPTVMDHKINCCVEHGCNFGEKACPVFLCRARQLTKCEECVTSHMPSLPSEPIITDRRNTMLRVGAGKKLC